MSESLGRTLKIYLVNDRFPYTVTLDNAKVNNCCCLYVSFISVFWSSKILVFFTFLILGGLNLN